jgi:hypothetical protein
MVLKFRDAFASAFYFTQRQLVWTNDRVLKTNVMQSYIYPAIGMYLDLALICELPADATYFPWQIVQPFIDTNRGYPSPTSAEVLVEHEIISSSGIKEMSDLAKYNAPLNVLITYFVGSVTAQAAWANFTFAAILGGLGNNARNFLLILPGQDPTIDPLVSEAQGSRYTPCVGWWNFFEWSVANVTFQRVP